MNVCYKKWDDQTRLMYDTCARKQRDIESIKPGYYIRKNIHTNTESDYINSLCEPAHYMAVYRDNKNINNETNLIHSKSTSPGVINQLIVRPYGGAYFGAGQPSLGNKNKESELLHGHVTRSHKSCTLPGVTIDRFEYLPEYGNPQRVQHVVEPWIRGGDNTRDHVRRVNYDKRLKNSKNNMIIKKKYGV